MEAHAHTTGRGVQGKEPLLGALQCVVLPHYVTLSNPSHSFFAFSFFVLIEFIIWGTGDFPLLCDFPIAHHSVLLKNIQAQAFLAAEPVCHVT